MSIKRVSKAKAQQFIGLFAGLAVFVALLTIALVTKPSADTTNPIGSSVVVGPVQTIVDSENNKIGEAKILLRDNPIAGQNVRAALVVSNTKTWSLKNNGNNVSFAPLVDIYRGGTLGTYNKIITDNDRVLMSKASENQFNQYSLTRVNQPVISVGGATNSIESKDIVWSIPDIANTTAKAQLDGWLSRNFSVCKQLDLTETAITSTDALQNALIGLTSTSTYCADTSNRVVDNLDIYMHSQPEEFMFSQENTTATSAHYRTKAIKHHIFSDILKWTPATSQFLQKPYISIPHTNLGKTQIQAIENMKFVAPPNSTSVSLLPEGQILAEFNFKVPDATVQNSNLDIKLPVTYVVPDRKFKEDQSIGSPFHLVKKHSEVSVINNTTPYYVPYCGYNYIWDNTGQFSGLNCDTSTIVQGAIKGVANDFCPWDFTAPTMTCGSGIKLSSSEPITGTNKANVFDVPYSYINAQKAVNEFNVKKTATITLSYPIVTPQILSSVSVALAPNTAIINSGDSVSATSKILDQFGSEYINRVGLTYKWEATEGASNITINNATGPEATIIGKNTGTAEVSSKIKLTVTSGTTSISSDPVTLTIKNLPPNESFTSVLVTPSSATMNNGEEKTFTAIAQDSLGRAVTSGISYQWTIGDATVITSSGSTTSSTVKVIAKDLTSTKTSSLTVKATDANNFSHNGNSSITVNAKPQTTTTTTGGGVVIPVITMAISPSSLALVSGNSGKLTATASINGVPNTSNEISYDWKSDKQTVAEVIGSGREVNIKANSVTTQTSATITLTASYRGISRSGTVGVIVIPAPVITPTTTTAVPTTTTTTTAVPTTTTTTTPDQAAPDINGHNTTYNYPSSSTFTSLVKNIPIKAGWNMLSLPYEATPINTAISRFAGLFGIDESIYLPHMYWYKSSINSYEDQYTSASPVGLGASTFVLSEKDRVADASDNLERIQTLSTTQAHAFEIPLNASAWTMVGNPYSTTISYDDSHIFVKIGNRIASISDAISEGIVTQAYAINSATNNYLIVSPSDTLSKYQGFWIRTNQPDTKLLIAPVSLTLSN